MKKIWIPILLLILLILFCLWNCAGKLNQPIDYTIKQHDKVYVVDGDFADSEQPSQIYKLLQENGAKEVNVTSSEFNGFLKDDNSLAVVEKILPSFVKNYKNGEIKYHDKKLLISGEVQDKSVKEEIDALLSNTKLNYSDRTLVVVPEPVTFMLLQKDELYELSGEFTNKSQLSQLQSICGNSGKLDSTNGVINEELVDKEGAVVAAVKIIPIFMDKYRDGKLEYTNRVLTVSGKVMSEDDKSLMKSYLSRIPSITVVNNTSLDTKRIKEARLAKEAADRAREEEIANVALAELNAQKEKYAAEEEQRLILAKETEALKEANRKSQEEDDNKTKLAEEKDRLAEIAKKDDLDKQKQAKNESALNQKISNLLKKHKIKFRYGSSRLNSVGRNTVKMVSYILEEYPSVNVEIGGHTDNIGSDEYNNNLSQSRVDSVKKKLEDYGISSKRMKSVGYGESTPLYSNSSRKNRRKNRRVEIKAIGE